MTKEIYLQQCNENNEGMSAEIKRLEVQNLIRKLKAARKSKDELETLQNKYALIMDINQALEKELAKRNKET